MVTIPQGMTRACESFTILDDAMLEGEETIPLILLGSPIDEDRDTATVIIEDNEELTVEFSEEEFSFAESSGLNQNAICVDVSTNVILSPQLEISVLSQPFEPPEAGGKKEYSSYEH